MFTEYKQFVVRQGKRPIDWRTGHTCDALDPALWLSHDLAHFYAAAYGAGYGVGFVLTAEDPFFLIDLDHCRTPEGQLTDLASSVLAQFAGCYAELSQSGEGLHIIGRMTTPAPPHRCRSEGIEFYTCARMISMTGQQPTGDTGHDPGEALGALIRDRFADPVIAGAVTWSEGPVPEYACDLDDDALIEKALGSPTNFALLWSGNIAAYGSDPSAADQALCNHLIFWTGGDCARVERLFERSGLCRDKWLDRSDYRHCTILSALATAERFYTATTGPIEWIHKGERGAVLHTRENVQAMITHLGGSCRYNLMSKKTELELPGEHNAITVNVLTSLGNQYRMNTTGIDRTVETIGRTDPYCPARDWILQAPWDGVDRLPALVATLSPRDSTLAPLLLRRWLLGAVAAVFDESGIQSPGVLVLQGDQGIGKTRWFNSLARADLIREGATLQAQVKDSYIQALGFWIVELSEMEQVYKLSSLDWLKSFLTNHSDLYRAPYGRTAENYPRRTVFVGTVNREKYLRDLTGNRRFLTIRCGSSIQYAHRIDMQQVWAQTLALLGQGEQYYLTQEESDMLADTNAELLPVTELHDLLASRYDLAAPRTRALTVTEILRELGCSIRPRGAGAIIAAFLGVKRSRKTCGRHVFDLPV